MTKNYQELIKDRIYIGGANDVVDVLENEKVDTVFDLRAESSPNASLLMLVAADLNLHCL